MSVPLGRKHPANAELTRRAARDKDVIVLFGNNVEAMAAWDAKRQKRTSREEGKGRQEVPRERFANRRETGTVEVRTNNYTICQPFEMPGSNEPEEVNSRPVFSCNCADLLNLLYF